MKMKRRIAAFLILSLLISIAGIGAVPAYAAEDSDKSGKAVLSAKRAELVEGDTFTLSVNNLKDGQTVTFRSSDSSVCSVSADDDKASLKAEGIGTVTITVKVKEKYLFFSRVVDTLECTVLVGPPALSIKCKRSKLSMCVGQTKRLSYTLKPSNTTEIPVFTSDSPTVVSISTSGRLVAKKIGKALITASIANENSTSCLVIVTEETADSKESNE